MNNQIEVIKKRKLFGHYYDNFEKHLFLGKLSKASEFLWGAIHSLIYAIALTYEKRLGTHSDVKEFVRQISNEERDETLYNMFKTGELLHANFYHDFLDEEGLKLKRIEMDILIKKLENILEKRIKLIKDSTEEETSQESDPSIE